MKNYFKTKYATLVVSFFVAFLIAALPSCKKLEGEGNGPVIASAKDPGLPLFAEYWGLLPEYNKGHGLVRAEDVPDGTNVVHLFTFDSSKDASTKKWKITNRFASTYENPIQVTDIPSDIATGIKDLQKRGIKVIFTVFTPKLTDLADATAFATAASEFVKKWALDGIEIDLEGNPAKLIMLSELGKLFGPASTSGKLLVVVDYANHNLQLITSASKYLDYMCTMEYWNTSSSVGGIVKSYAKAIGDPKKVLIGVGGGPGISAGQATKRGEELKIANWLKQNSPGTGMMNFIMDADYDTPKDGGISRSMEYSIGIIKALKQ